MISASKLVSQDIIVFKANELSYSILSMNHQSTHMMQFVVSEIFGKFLST